MENYKDNIYPIDDRLLQKGAKEKLMGQIGKVIWMTGLSGSGKSTVAQHLEAKLHAEGFVTMVLDGDNIRSGLNNNLSFTVEDRQENIRRIAEVSKLFKNCGIVTINSFISPTNAIRSFAKEIIGEEDFIEVFISASLDACEDRDVKGLYKKARKGEIKNFTGIDSPYEVPENPALVVRTDLQSIEESVESVYQYIMNHIKKSE